MFSSSALRASGRKVQSAHSIWQTHVRNFNSGEVWEVGRATGSSPKWEQPCDFGVVRVPLSHRPFVGSCWPENLFLQSFLSASGQQ